MRLQYPSSQAAAALLSITSVHPMRKEVVCQFLAPAAADWSVIQRLIAQEQLMEMEYAGRKFYMRKLRSWSRGHVVLGQVVTG